MFRIQKEFSFSASHSLTGLRADHPCSRDHGHNYVIVIVMRASDLDRHGFVRDYRKLDWFKEFIDKNLDHQNLNVMMHKLTGNAFQTTAEMLARYLFDHINLYYTLQGEKSLLECVRVSETPKTWAEYKPCPDREEMALRIVEALGESGKAIRKLVKDAIKEVES